MRPEAPVLFDHGTDSLHLFLTKFQRAGSVGLVSEGREETSLSRDFFVGR